MVRLKDLTNSPTIKAKYKSLWDRIDTIDLKHANTGHEWQVREIEFVLKELDSFHTENSIEQYEYETKRFAESITICSDRIRKDINNADYLIINRFKDAIHKIWQEGFQQDYDEESRWNSNWYKQIEKLAKEIGLEVDRKKFWKVSEKIKMTVGDDRHSAESYEKNELLRYMVLSNALKEKVGDDAEDIFSLMIHDMYQNMDGCKFIGEDMQDLVEARELGITTELQFIRLMKLASEVLPLYYYRGKNTWMRDDLETQWDFESNYVTDHLRWIRTHELIKKDGDTTTWQEATEDEVKNTIACARISCYNRIKLTTVDIYKLEHGKKLDMKFCCKKCKLGKGK